MKRLVATLCVVLVASPLAVAQEKGKAEHGKAGRPVAERKVPTEKQGAQLERMKACNKQAADKKLRGEERSRFMRACLAFAAAGSPVAGARDKDKAQEKKARAAVTAIRPVPSGKQKGGKSEAAAAFDKMKPQQEKMKACNKQAAERKLQGDERTRFLSKCLKG